MSHDDLKSSAHVWGDGDGVRDRENAGESESDTTAPTARQPSPSSQLESTSVPAEAPPAYSSAATPHATVPRGGPSTSQPRALLNPLSQLAALATIPFHQYQLPASTLSPDRVVQTTTHPPFHSRPESLAALLKQQAALPPKPSLRITGTHSGTRGETKVDFDLSISLLSLLSPPINSSNSSPRLRLQAPPPTPSSPGSKLFKSSSNPSPPTPLQAWTRHFCITDKSEHRSLTLTRTIADLRPFAAALEGRVRNLLAALKYRGKLDISFPVEHRDVVVLKQPGNWLVGLLRIYPEKKFEVAQAVWEFSGGGENDGEGEASDGKDSPAAAADRWWRVWEGPVRNAVLGQTRGRVGVEEWIAWSMGAAEEERRLEWGVDGVRESSF